MSAKMKRRRRHARRKRILTERREFALFYAHGTFPRTARTFAVCPCGSRAFSTDPHDLLEDFEEQHRYCDQEG